jgi:hypothetical protein
MTKLDDLIKEFLDAAGIEDPKPPDKPLGLSFDTSIREWSREELEDLIREFIRFIEENK